MARKVSLLILITILLTNFSCSSSGDSQGVFDKPITGKALSVTVTSEVRLIISNPSSAKIPITPIKVKFFYKNGTETESVYELKSNNPGKIEIKLVGDTLGTGNSNQSEPAKSGSPASISPGESIGLPLLITQSAPPKVQVSIGQEGSKEQEVFLITKRP